MKLRSILAIGAVAAIGAILTTACGTDAYCFEGCEGTVAGSGGSGGALAHGGSGGGFTVRGGSGGGLIFGGGAAGKAGSGGSTVCTADTQTDPKNCGSCGNECDVAGAFPKCVAGKCLIDMCAPGRQDLDKDPSDGCEYACTPTTPSTEVCDEKDNDCNGKVDDGFDLQTDIANCGSCGNSCAKDEPNATTTACVKGACSITKCADGFADPDKIPTDGCEYKCPVFPPVPETCDGVDNDCDGVVDNGNPGGGEQCTETCPGGSCVGQCTPGIQQCAGNGKYICTPGVGPSIEVCDNVDNDCNGTVDDGYDLTTDIQNCGTCGTVCAYANGEGSCVGSMCQFDGCKPGFADLDGTPGCEYQCPQAIQGVEICDGVDNDCDGLIDAADPDLVTPVSICKTTAGTLCANATFTCEGDKGFLCNYPAGVEVDADGDILPSELVCDGIDGNCDGTPDETFPAVNTGCTDGKIGACASTGTFQCNDQHNGVQCNITTNGGQPADHESCNGIDDDCNGAIDDNLQPSAFSLVTIPGSTVSIDAYEASRPDATASKEGAQSAVSCSNANVLPWTALSFEAATAACTARGAGFRLCTAAELSTACGDGTHANAYPYGNAYAGTTCNGADNGSPSTLKPTGSLAACVTPEGVFDLSGNASEWSSTKTGDTKTTPDHNIYQLGGGGFLSPPEGLECVIGLAPRAAENAILEDVGFRCCKDP